MSSKKMKLLPPSEQPYEKVLEHGPEVLSDAELLAVILRTGAKDISARDLAEEILKLKEGEGLRGLLSHSLWDYREIKGIGAVKAVQLSCVGELSRRIWKTAKTFEDPVFDSPAKVAARYMEELRHLEQENLKLLVLNAKNKLIREMDISRGTATGSLITPREIFMEALRHRGVGIILLHNHPSGDPSPSREDCLFTARVQEAGKIMGILLLDHIVIGDHSYVSLKERGILDT